MILSYISFAFFSILLGPIYCRGKYDIIFFSLSPVGEGIPAIVFKKIKRVPVVFWVQDLWPEILFETGAIRFKSAIKIVEFLLRCIYKRCDRILIQSKAFFQSVNNLAEKPESIFYFPNSAESFYRPLDLDANTPEAQELPAGFKIMFAGNIGASQGFETIISAAEKIKEYGDIHWVVIGEGRMRAWVEQEIKRRGLELNFHLLPRKPVEAMPRYFAQADVLLVTLKKDPVFAVTIPGKLQSYLACGKPIIASINGEGARIVNEAGAGFGIPADDPETLAKTVLKMHSLPKKELFSMGNNGRVYFEKNFESKMLVNSLCGWLNDLKKEETVR